MSFNVCSREVGCVPVYVSENGVFTAKLLPTISSWTVMKMWDVVDWNKVTERRWDKDIDILWSGCNMQKTWLNQVVCNVSNMAPRVIPQSPTPRQKWTKFDTIIFVGDSTMKRTFDAALRLMCKKMPCTHLGKLHSNTQCSCNGIHFTYLFSAGRPGEPNREYRDTSKALESINRPSNTTLVIFNSGHNYINLPPKSFHGLVERMYLIVKNWPHYVVLTSPAYEMELVKPNRRCQYNNVRVQKSNGVLFHVFPDWRVLDLFWWTLHSGENVDFIHYKDHVYDNLVQKIVKRVPRNDLKL